MSILCHEVVISYPQDNRKLRYARNNSDTIRQI